MESIVFRPSANYSRAEHFVIATAICLVEQHLEGIVSIPTSVDY